MPGTVGRAGCVAERQSHRGLPDKAIGVQVRDNFCAHGGNRAKIREGVIAPPPPLACHYKEMGSPGKSEVGARIAKEPRRVIRNEHRKSSNGRQAQWLAP